MKRVLLFIIALIFTLPLTVLGQTLLITEVVDGTASGATPRYVEISNPTDASINLEGLKINKYTNGSSTANTAYTFTAYDLPSKASIVVVNIADNTKWADYNLTAPTHAIYKANNINNNGDDVYELATAAGATIDIYGVIGTDGSGKDWEYLDSYAYRNSSILVPSTGFSSAQWTFGGKGALSGKAGDLSPYLTPGTHTFDAPSSDPLITLSSTSLSNFTAFTINTNPSAEQSFKVSGSNLTADITITAPANYEMSIMSGFIAPPTSKITLAQTGGTVDETTIYVRLKAGLVAGEYNEDITLSSTDADNKTVSCSGKVIAPMTTTLPYSEDFTNELNEVYTFTVTGSKPWKISGDAAQANGWGGEDTEEHWLILKGIDFDANTNELMSFKTKYNYKEEDANNYLKLMYSTDYPGLGDPTAYTWVNIDFTKPTSMNTLTPSGMISLSSISGNAYIAFKYYSTDKPSQWNIDDIEIVDQEPITVTPDELNNFEGFSVAGVASNEQSFKVTGIALTADLNITAPDNYELSLTSGSAFAATSPIVLSQTAGSVDETTIYVRLKAELDAGDYNEDITIASTGVTSKTIACSGKVFAPMTATLPYTEEFTNLEQCYTYNVAGNKNWYLSNESARANGHGGANPEEQWLILKGIDFDTYTEEVISFKTSYDYGADDEDNYLKLMYSTDYPGVGNPADYTWTELAFTKPDAKNTPTNSGSIDLSSLSGTNYIAFKYHSTTNARRWDIDDINIIEDKATDITNVKKSAVKVGPNPFNNEIIIDSANDIKVVRLYNTAGQVVKNVPANNGRVETADVPAGLFILQIEFTDGTSTTQKVIKK